MEKKEIAVETEPKVEQEPPEKGSGDFESLLGEEINKLILNSSLNKYDVVILARRWAYELKAKDNKGRSVQELIAQAIMDLLDKKVSFKTIKELPPLQLSKKPKSPAAALLENVGKQQEPEQESETAKKTKSSERTGGPEKAAKKGKSS